MYSKFRLTSIASTHFRINTWIDALWHVTVSSLALFSKEMMVRIYIIMIRREDKLMKMSTRHERNTKAIIYYVQYKQMYIHPWNIHQHHNLWTKDEAQVRCNFKRLKQDNSCKNTYCSSLCKHLNLPCILQAHRNTLHYSLIGHDILR